MSQIPEHPFEGQIHVTEMGSSSSEQTLQSSLQQGVQRTEHPLDLQRMLESQENFNQEMSLLTSHGDKIRVNFSADLGDIKKTYTKLSFEEFIANPTGRNALNRFIENRIAFAGEVYADIHADMDDICSHFQMNKEDIKEISLKFLGADSHNKGKSTVLIEFVTNTGETKSIFYKPRLMKLEHLTCDNEKGIFSQLKHFPGIDELGDVAAFTYPVLSVVKEDRHYGYSQKIDGQVLYDEKETPPDEDPSITSPHFMIPENPMTTREFLELVTSLKELAGADVALAETCDASFFSTRSNEQLKSDYLLFFVLSLLKLSDLHCGNFIRSDPSGILVPIDLECIQEGDAAMTLLQIQVELDRRGIELPQGPLDKIKDYIENLHLDHGNEPLREVPIATGLLCVLREKYLTKRALPAIAEFKREIQESYVIDDIKSVDRLIDESFKNFDIPYFILRGDQLFFDGVHVGRRKTQEELEQTRLETEAFLASSANSVVINEDEDSS